MEALEHLQQINLFKNLPATHVAALAGIAKREHYNPGERLAVQGDLGNRFFIVDSGLVNLRQTDKYGIERSIGVVPSPPSEKSTEPPKRYFGDQMFTTQEPFEFHADAVRPTEVFVISREDFDALVEQRPGILHMLGFVRTAEKKRTHGYAWVTEGENVAIVERKHWWALLPGLVPVVAVTAAALVILLVLRFILVPEMLQWVALGAAVLIVLVLAYQVYDWINDEYIVTNQRVAHVERVVFRLELRESVPIEKVLGVTLERKFPAAYFGCSTVIVQTAGREEGNVTFEFIGRGEKIRKMIQDEQDRVQARQVAEERDRFRQSIRQELRHYLMPDAVAAEQAAKEAQAAAPQPRHPRTTRRLLQKWVASWLNLELREPGRTRWRKHWIVLFRQAGAWFLGLLILDALAFFFAVNPSIQFPGYWLGGLVALVILLAGLLYQWEDWRNDIYVVTESQVIDTESLPFGLSSKSTVAPLDQVQDIRVEVPGMFAFLLNYGDVKIETAGQSGQMVFYSIHKPRDAQEEIFRRLEAFRARRAEQEASIRSRTVIDALLAYDQLKHEQQSSSAPNPGETPPNQNPGG